MKTIVTVEESQTGKYPLDQEEYILQNSKSVGGESFLQA